MKQNVTSIKEGQDPESQIKCVIDLVESQIEEEKTNKNTDKDLDFFAGLKIRTYILDPLRPKEPDLPVHIRRKVSTMITGAKHDRGLTMVFVLNKWIPLPVSYSSPKWVDFYITIDEETEYKDDLGQWRPFSELLPKG